MKKLSIFLVAFIGVAAILFVQNSFREKKRMPRDNELLESVVGDKDDPDAALRFRHAILAGNHQNVDLAQMRREAVSNVVYAGTGEGWGNLDAVYGGGIYKSTDFGDTWTLLASTSNRDSQHSEQIETVKERIAMDIPPTIPPNNCRVIATVESIDKRLSGANVNDPCGKAPCIATVRIDTVIRYGSAFPKPLSAGQKLVVKFGHTLSQTKQNMPEVKPPLPSLDVGSQFEALVDGSLAMGSSDPTLTIYGYVKK